MRKPLRTTTKSLILMTAIAAVFVGAVVFADEDDHHKIVVKEHQRHADTDRPWLGVYLGETATSREDDEGYLRAGRGIRILSVIEDSPAERAGFEDGDVIIGFNGVPIADEEGFYREFRSLRPGDAVDVIVLRDGDEEQLEVILGERPGRTIILPHKKDLDIHIPKIHLPEMRKRGYLGVHLQEMTDELRDYFEVPAGEGVLVSKVEPDSPAGEAGLRAGDVITDAGGEIIRNSGDLIRALGDVKKDDPLDITFYRDGRSDTVTVLVGETESHVLDINSFIWCDEDDEDCEATFEIGPGSYAFDFDYDFDTEAFQHSMEKLNEYFNSEEFQKMIQEHSRSYEKMEREMEKKMQELERKLEEVEERLQELREEEEAHQNHARDLLDQVRTTGRI